MKTTLLLLFLSIVSLLQGQEQNHSEVLQIVDSLITVNRTLVGEQSFAQALKVIEKAGQLAKPVSSTTYARCLYNHGRTYNYAAQYSKSPPYFLEALTIQEKDPGKEHADYAYSLTGLANAYRELGRLEEAGPMYLESKEIRKKVFGEEHPAYAGALNNLAILYWELGDYKKTEYFLLESRTIREKTFGREHSQFAASLHNLAVLYLDMGQYEKAEKLFKESIDLKAKTLGKEHPEYGESLQSLANLYSILGRNEEAKSLFLESLSNSEKSFGKENHNSVFRQLNLAGLYVSMEHFEKAEILYREALGIISKIEGKECQNYAITLNNLGNLYRTAGKKENVVSLFEESLQILNRTSSKTDPKYSLCLQGLADAYQIQNTSVRAEKALTESIKLQRSRLLNAVSFLSEKELTEYTELFEDNVFRIFNFLHYRSENKISPGNLTKLAYDNLLYYKGYLLTAVRQMNGMAAANPATVGLFNELKSCRRRLAREYALHPQNRDRIAVAGLEEKANSIEKELANRIADYASANQQISWEEVQAQLKPSEAAIEFIHFPINFPQSTDSVLYAALILKPGVDQPIFVPLFEEKQLANIITGNTATDRNVGITQLYTRGVTPAETGNREGLYKIIWAPLDSLLADEKKIYYAPSGLLHRISFDAIAGENNELLSDRFQLYRVGSTRTLTQADSLQHPVGHKIVLFGGINYDIDPSAKEDLSVDVNPVSVATEIPFAMADRGFLQRGAGWAYLKGTETEVKGISEVLKEAGHPSQIFAGSSASEATFKALAYDSLTPRIIHIATHGFFFPDPERDTKHSASAPTFKISDHPMIRSGLLFAGANETWSTGKSPTSQSEDGILTAYEISQMDLSNTELVVLSACETGLGDIKGNEGVYGLQRAFKIAGVKHLIMSLWKVPDEHTAKLMIKFYAYWFQHGLGVPEALKAAQRDMRESKSDPYLWAGFVILE